MYEKKYEAVNLPLGKRVELAIAIKKHKRIFLFLFKKKCTEIIFNMHPNLEIPCYRLQNERA